MNFIHRREYLNQGDIVQLLCDTQCNFMLTDDMNFASYRRGERFQYFGGHFGRSPSRIVAPRADYWNITVDLGGGSANIRYKLGFIKSN